MIRTPCAGIHLSGPNASKTAVVVLRPSGQSGTNGETTGFELVRVYEKIGSFGNLFSDDRLFGILTREGPFGSVFVDCPLTVPPCVDCVRPACPGVIHCEDVGVAWMLSVAERPGAARQRRRRKVNPQGQRLWDVLQLSGSHSKIQDPTYNSNNAPLVVRARTLQRRLNSSSGAGVVDPVKLMETNVPMVVDKIAVHCGISSGSQMPSVAYRNFEVGYDFRRAIIQAMVRSGLLSDNPGSEFRIGSLHQSMEVFHALITAWVACLQNSGKTSSPVDGFVEAGGGWVHLPETSLLPNFR